MALTEAQWGVIARRQMIAAGVAPARISRLAGRDLLHRLYTGVYAVGHRRLETKGRLMAALLHAGEGAMLAGLTAAWWWGIIPIEPHRIHLIAPGGVRSDRRVRVAHPAGLRAVHHNGLPICTAARAIIDIASLTSEARLRKAISEALYLGRTTVAKIEAELGCGIPGSAVVRRALERHRLGIQRSRSEVEESFFLICERASLPLPGVNRRVAGFEVDFVWRELRLAVEVDGPGHAEVARMRDDRAKEMALRAAGYDLLRYADEQVKRQSREIGAELRRQIAHRQRTGGESPTNSITP